MIVGIIDGPNGTGKDLRSAALKPQTSAVGVRRLESIRLSLSVTRKRCTACDSRADCDLLRALRPTVGQSADRCRFGIQNAKFANEYGTTFAIQGDAAVHNDYDIYQCVGAVR